MPHQKNNFFIFTGAPGVGKTTLLKELTKSFKTIPEPAREILHEQRLINGTAVSEKDQKQFRDLILSRSINKYLSNINTNEVLLFDRGIPDVASYSNAFNLSSEIDLNAAEEFRYNKTVFILPPWEEIYVTDDERKMKFEQLQEFHESLVENYERVGYKLVVVQKMSVTERCDFVKNYISNSLRTNK